MTVPQHGAYPVAPAWRPLLPQPPRAALSMVLGIVGVAGSFVLLLPVLASPLAWYFGARAQREAERHPDLYRRSSEARAGAVLGMIGTAILGLVLLMLFVGAALTLVAARYDAGYGT